MILCSWNIILQLLNYFPGLHLTNKTNFSAAVAVAFVRVVTNTYHDIGWLEFLQSTMSNSSDRNGILI